MSHIITCLGKDATPRTDETPCDECTTVTQGDTIYDVRLPGT